MHPDFTFDEERDLFICNACGADVPRGIFSISGHWVSCSGKGVMDNVMKIDRMSLGATDKIDLVKGL